MGLRVLMFGWEFPPHNSGGLGVACEGLSEALVEHDLDLLFVLPQRFEIPDSKVKFVYPKEGSLKNITYAYVHSNLNPYISSTNRIKQESSGEITVKRDSDKVDLIGEVLKYEARATDIAKQEDFDVIHAHDWLSFGAGIAAKKATGKKLIVHIHATEFDRSGEHPHPFIFNKEKEGFEAADKIIAVSGYTKNIVVQKYGIPASKVMVVHNGIDPRRSTSQNITEEKLASFKQQGKKIVLFLGRLTLQKNPDGLLKAAKEVTRLYPNVVFIFAGSGDMQEQLIEEAVGHGLSDKVFFPGFVRGDEKIALFKSADLFVMPSLSEPFGLVALESLLNETPVLISKQSGVSEAVNHALKVDFWDTKDMANKIITVLKYRSLKKTLTENGTREAWEVSWKRAAEKIVDIYKDHV